MNPLLSWEHITGPSLTFEQVSLRLGRSAILDDVSLRVEAGTVHCLIGPNGGGKTSLARCLIGQMPHTGRIAIEWATGRTIGYVPQVLDFDRTLPITVENFMAMICQRRPAFWSLHRQHRAAVSQALSRLGIEMKRHRQLGQLSGGEMQRVLFAQALIPPPALLILDEPASGLDEAGAQIFETAIYDLREQGVTILWIHHDLKQVKRMADVVTCLNRRILFSGLPQEVMDSEHILRLFSAQSRNNIEH